MLMSFCKGGNVIKLPQLEALILDSLPNFTSKYQHLLNKEVMISKLKKLKIRNMEKLKEIWSSQLSNNDQVICQLRELTVHGCDRLVNFFPNNQMSLLHHLEQLTVTDCGSIDVLFNIDLGCVGEIQESSSNLRSIKIRRLGELRDVWRVINGVNNSNDDLPILGFQSVEYIKIEDCKRLRNVFTPTTSNFDMRALKEITIDGYDGWGENRSDNEMVESSQQKEEINVVSNEYISEVDDDIPNVAFPSYLIHTFHSLRTLFLSKCKEAEVAFEIDSLSSRKLATTRNNQPPLLLRHLEVLQLNGMDNMTHVWKYDWIQFLISQQEPKSFSFHNLSIIRLTNSKRIKYLFSPLMAKFLPNLKSINIEYCGAIEEVVSNRDDENKEMATSISSHTN
ncbi:hypothetical protein L6452_08159 [Arctium lappa]|uniref:Uncharacterized protein n=1 Tax=Arctium lappa TaxID=4217 RepID=A0ACB9DHI6_ARCLA|nr:hypothetical protein L6452_08159 [Arctium lappa]